MYTGKKVLVIDDTKLVRKIITAILKSHEIDSFEAENGLEGLTVLEAEFENIRAITVDVEMPIMDGFEFVKKVKEKAKYRNIPLIFVTSLSEREEIERGLELGVYDYIIKPVEKNMVYLKIRNAIQSYENSIELEELNNSIMRKNLELETMVSLRTRELEEMTRSLITALESANFYNDENTGKHIMRVAAYSELIAKELGMPQDFVEKIKLYAPIHDIGKVGIPDEILKKPGKYTSEEFEIMKKHVIIGYNMLKDSPIPDIAKNIILYHHEKWNGEGYGAGLKGEAIPIEARIVAISDVFDALSTKRIYKDKFEIDETLNIMRDGREKHFDPNIFDLFLKNLDKVLAVKEKYKDEE
jgi:putative two-component system response regulator